jgi:hypothetical protein
MMAIFLRRSIGNMALLGGARTITDAGSFESFGGPEKRDFRRFEI